MCNKAKLYEKEGIRFLLTLPAKHKNRIKTECVKHLKIVTLQEVRKEEQAYEKHKF